MGRFANLKGLNHFRQKLEEAKLKYADLEEIVRAICEAGQNYARSLYGGSENVTITAEFVGNVGKIVAEGEQIAYLEFGTGERGSGTYEGQLPENALTFYSNRLGRDVTLEYGWTYSYANKLDDTQAVWQGFAAKAQMWKTAQYLRENIAQIVKKVVNK